MTSRAKARSVADAGVPPGVARGWGLASLVALVRAYVALSKPGIVLELLVITVPAMILAAHGWPSADLIGLTLLGGVLTGGGANAINQWYDRDIDRIMARTAGRPIPSGRVAPGPALVWGVLLVTAGTVQLALTVNWLVAVLALAAAAFYAFIYTAWLKRTTVHNTVAGGIAGAAPPLIGWVAVTESIDVAPVILFLIVFLWQPPHFWALALRYREEYASAGVPMLPVVRGARETHKQSLFYAVLMVAATVALYIVGDAGEFYFGAALGLGLLFLGQLVRQWRGAPPMQLFAYSIVYLTLLFAALAADEFIV